MRLIFVTIFVQQQFVTTTFIAILQLLLKFYTLSENERL